MTSRVFLFSSSLQLEQVIEYGNLTPPPLLRFPEPASITAQIMSLDRPSLSPEFPILEYERFGRRTDSDTMTPEYFYLARGTANRYPSKLLRSCEKAANEWHWQQMFERVREEKIKR